MTQLTELHPRVQQNVEERLELLDHRGCLYFGGEASMLLAHILELDDELPAKASALADLAAMALWYAHNLREETR